MSVASVSEAKFGPPLPHLCNRSNVAKNGAPATRYRALYQLLRQIRRKRADFGQWMSTGRIVGMQLDGFEPVRFEDRAVQRRAIDAPLADGDACDLIFDNDGAGEVADVVSLRVTNGLVQVTLHHLQTFKLHDARHPRQRAFTTSGDGTRPSLEPGFGSLQR